MSASSYRHLTMRLQPEPSSSFPSIKTDKNRSSVKETQSFSFIKKDKSPSSIKKDKTHSKAPGKDNVITEQPYIKSIEVAAREEDVVEDLVNIDKMDFGTSTDAPIIERATARDVRKESSQKQGGNNRVVDCSRLKADINGSSIDVTARLDRHRGSSSSSTSLRSLRHGKDCNILKAERRGSSTYIHLDAGQCDDGKSKTPFISRILKKTNGGDSPQRRPCPKSSLPKRSLTPTPCEAIHQRIYSIDTSDDAEMCKFPDTRDVYGNIRWSKGEDICQLSQQDCMKGPHDAKVYPYRYTSAGPSFSNRTKKEQNIRRCLMKVCRKKLLLKEYELRLERDPEGVYMTTTEYDQLNAMREMARKGRPDFLHHIPDGLTETLRAPPAPCSQFATYITQELHPDWRHDPLYNRRVLFKTDPHRPKLPWVRKF